MSFVKREHGDGYRTLSPTADVDLTDFGPERGVRMNLLAKYVGEPKK